MTKPAVFTIEIDDELRDAFLAAAAASNAPATQVLRGLMRDFVESRKAGIETADEAYASFLAAKVARARTSMADGQGRAGREVEGKFAAKRAALLRKAGGPDA